RAAPSPRKGPSPPLRARNARTEASSPAGSGGRPARRKGASMSFQLNLEQLRKQAKERLRETRAAGRSTKLADAQFELARDLGFASWPRLKSYVERLRLEQPFHTDLEYYEDRASGIASFMGVGIADARRDLAGRHGFHSWSALRRH